VYSDVSLQNELKDFRNFLYLLWDHLRLPEPTPVQYDMADYLQNGPKRSIIEAFRGVGKSWITVGFCAHQLMLNPELKIEVVSASKVLADNFSTFLLDLIYSFEPLQHLAPRPDQRTSKVQFDVGPARPSKDPAVKSVGITGQITGTRADIIIADDIEVPANSQTQVQREKLRELVKEFDSILKPDGRIIYLGTPHTEDSLYNELPKRGYEKRIWTARYPTQESMVTYGDDVAPKIAKELEENPKLVGKPTDPKRFNEEDLFEREASYGRSGFQLQFMLNTQLSDMERYPLKLSDLVVMDLDASIAPEKVVWASGPQQEIKGLNNVGFNGDRYFSPMSVVGEFIPYTGVILAVDPSGRGKDECAWGALGMLNSQIFLLDVGYSREGYTDKTLQSIVEMAKFYKAQEITVESNFGDGMFNQLLQPYVSRIYPCAVEEVKHSIQKEKRIIDTLEPVMNQHRLIVNKKLVDEDYSSTQELPAEERNDYRLFYQMSRITREKGALKRDDRLDMLAIGVNRWVELMSLDADVEIHSRKQELLDLEIERFLEHSIDLKGSYSPKNQSWI